MDEWLVSMAYFQNEGMIIEPYHVPVATLEQTKRWKPEFTEADLNQDGQIEYHEYKAYYCEYGKGWLMEYCLVENELEDKIKYQFGNID